MNATTREAGTSEAAPPWKVVVPGGGAAGVPGGGVPSRARPATPGSDAGEPRNGPAARRGYPGRAGLAPREFPAKGREKPGRYGGMLLPGPAAAAPRTPEGGNDRTPEGQFAPRLGNDRTQDARAVPVVTGPVGELPVVPGLFEQWGAPVHRRPRCPGEELHGRSLTFFPHGEEAGAAGRQLPAGNAVGPRDGGARR
ncbi:hypothetical protein [Streptomyces hoynatensis]|nr:hypothetical protein [Streptomyces hoynatensis]